MQPDVQIKGLSGRLNVENLLESGRGGWRRPGFSGPHSGMQSRIDTIRLKIERANEHIRDLEIAVRGFFESRPYTVGIKPNPDIPQLWQHYITDDIDIPAEIPLLSGDALQNLRTALDYLVNQLILASGATPRVGSGGASLPICKSATEYEATKQRKMQGMSPDRIKAIDAVKPYKGGNDTLWRLQQLNNMDKHRLVLTTGIALVGLDLFSQWGKAIPAFQAFARHGYQFIPHDKICPLKAGSVLFEDTEVHDNFKVTTQVAFAEPQIAEGESVIETLKAMSDLISDLLSKFAPLL